MKKLVFFASGSGSNFQAVIDAIESKNFEAEIAGLITNKDGIGAIERAKKHRIPVKVVRDFGTDTATGRIKDQLMIWKPDLIVLAGFLKKIPDEILESFKDKIINIHPALLPKYGGKGFYGINVHRAVLEARDRETGCTVHYVNEKYDHGTIIKQLKINVLSDDTPETLAERVLSLEHKLLPVVIKQILNQNN